MDLRLYFIVSFTCTALFCIILSYVWYTYKDRTRSQALKLFEHLLWTEAYYEQLGRSREEIDDALNYILLRLELYHDKINEKRENLH